MSNETNRQKIENFFVTEYRKLTHYVRKNIEARFFGSTPEDIVQDVALSILSKLDFELQFENLAGYIYRSLRNRSIDVSRQKLIAESADNPGYGMTNLLEQIPEELEYDLFQELGITEEHLHEAIAKLNEDDQSIIMLTEFEGISFAELSEEWDVPIGTLLSRKHRALAKIYKLLVNTDKTITNKINNYGNKRKIPSQV